MMADFLSRVAEKALGAAGPVAPRLPSLFEPMHGDAAMPVFGPAPDMVASSTQPEIAAALATPPPGGEAGEAADAVARSIRRGVLLVPGPSDRVAFDAPHMPPSTPLSTAPDSATALPVPANTPAMPPAPGTATPTSPAPGQAGGDTAERAPPSPAPARTPRHASAMLRIPAKRHAGRPAAGDTDGSAPQHLAANGMPMVPAPPSPVVAAAAAPASPSPVASARASLLPVAVASAPALAAPAALFSAPAALFSASAAASAAPQAPVINVTIGRVEVRAGPGPQPRPGNHASGPKPLSLDEYLKRQGERR